mmetsp:Transcript_60671/g.141357  ORF Transcript_60671/g.141357 Transcript_60671/m.141357 type:complete len:844 (+) Transcript_60671:47-2578(+)
MAADRGGVCELQRLTFPATRKILWDRTPRGPARRICAEAWQPTVVVSKSVLQKLSQHVLGGCSTASVTLAAHCEGGSVPGRGQLSVVIDRCFMPGEALPELSPDELPVRCSLCRSEPGLGSCASPSVEALRLAAAARDAAFRGTVHLGLGDGLAWAAVIAAEPQGRWPCFRLGAALPSWVFSMTLLATPLRTLETPLLSQLRLAGRNASLGFGFLTLDLGRRAVCLHEADGLVGQVPLVGIWVDLAGNSGNPPATAAAWWDAAELVNHPLIWTASARFAQSQSVGEHVWVDDATFLVMVVHRCGGVDDTCLSFFEARQSELAEERALLAPADGALAVPADLNASGGERLQLSTRVVALTEVPSAGHSENPEEDVPPCGLTLGPVHNAQIPQVSPQARGSSNSHTIVKAAEPLTNKARTPCSSSSGTLDSTEHIEAKVGPRLQRWGRSPSPGRAAASGTEASCTVGPGGACKLPPRHTLKRWMSPAPEDVSPYGDAVATGHRLWSSVGERFVDPDTAAPERSVPAEDEQAALRKLVSMQQAQLSEMQQQLTALHDLVANLVSRVQFSEEQRRSCCDVAVNTEQDTPRSDAKAHVATRFGDESPTQQAHVEVVCPAGSTRPESTPPPIETFPPAVQPLQPFLLGDRKVEKADTASHEFAWTAVVMAPCGTKKASPNADSLPQDESREPCGAVAIPGSSAVSLQAAFRESSSSPILSNRVVAEGYATSSGLAHTMTVGAKSCLRDSADTAGGGTPPAPKAAGMTGLPLRSLLGRTSGDSDEMPRIVCPSSASLSGSDSDLDDLPASELGSVDSSSVLGFTVGLPQLARSHVAGAVAMPMGPLQVSF